MNRGEIITRFREENPEITTNVVTNAVLQSWVEVGDQEVGVRTRLIKSSATFTATIDQDTYSLVNEITKFYDIDEYPGGGVAFNNKRLTLETPSSLDVKRPSWRTATSGTPKDYYRRQGNIVLGKPPSTASTIKVYTILVPNALDDDTKLPFNELSYLEPFHYSLVLYLKMRTFMGKVKKKDMGMAAQQEFESYIKWMNGEINRGIYTKIQIKAPINYRGTSRNNSR